MQKEALHKYKIVNDLDQPMHQHSLMRVFAFHKLILEYSVIP